MAARAFAADKAGELEIEEVRGEALDAEGGHADLQGRPSYEPTAIQQGNRLILYVGHHQGNFFNPLTQAIEPDGTSIVDVTNPRNPRQLYHIPGPPGGNQDN